MGRKSSFVIFVPKSLGVATPEIPEVPPKARGVDRYVPENLTESIGDNYHEGALTLRPANATGMAAIPASAMLTGTVSQKSTS